MDAKLEIFTFGGVRISQGGEPVVGLTTRKSEALLIYLASTRRPQPREVLADLFWADRSQSQAMGNLRGALSNLHQVAGESLDISRTAVSLNDASPIWLDSVELEECLNAIRQQGRLNSTAAEQASKALALYTGEFLEGFMVYDCPEFEQWAVRERERLHRLVVDSLAELVAYEIEKKAYQPGIAHAARLIALDPLNEHAHRQFMRLMSSSGQRNAALAQFETCKKLLKEELGVAPEAETLRLYEQIRAGIAGAGELPGGLPSGTVTFLYTDIEGSTRLLSRLKKEYATVLAEQRDLLRAEFERWNGREMDTQGDSFFVAFSQAMDALHCVLEAQHALVEHSWPEGVTVRVRMGLHTGEPIISKTGYVGIDVVRASRIMNSGHGGQVLLSQTTRDLVYQDLPKGTSLRDLGAHKLKDIRFPQQIYQLEMEGLPCDFPPLKTLSTEEEPPAVGDAPFKGLQYFTEEDAHLFFGRSLVTQRLVQVISLERFLAVIGASGSGKSSVVRAGLIPALKNSQPRCWQIMLLTPTAHPLEALAVALTHSAESVIATTTLMDDLKQEPRALQTFARKLILPSTRESLQMLLVIDQFEELFTLCRDAGERQAFVDNLLTAATASHGPVHVLITLRADFYEHLAEYGQLRELVARHQEYLGVMSGEELRQAIEEPARLGGWEFSPGLVDLMLHEIGAEGDHQPEPGALPLLSHALLETWKHRRGNLMNLKAYGESGGVRKAIAHSAEHLYTQVLTPAQQQIARNIFLRLTELGEGTQDTRRRASFQELYPPAPYGDPKDVEEVLVKLADARLIITGEDTAEVAHEALIREWPTLREWLMQDREGLRLQRHLTEAAQEWLLLERDPGMLYRGARLVQALEWARANPQQLNEREKAFLEVSQSLAEQEEAEREAARLRELEAARKLAETERQRAEAERQRAEERGYATQRLRRRALYLWIALVCVAILAGAAGWLGLQSNAAARLASSRELTSAAQVNLKIDPQLSAHLALNALQKERTFEAENALHAVVPEMHLLSITKMPKDANHFWWARDAELYAAGTPDGIAVIDFANGKKFTVKSGENCLGVNPSTDGRYLATLCVPDGSKDPSKVQAQVAETATGKVLFTIPDVGAGFRSGFIIPPAATNPFLLYGNYSDLTTHVWNISTGQELFVFHDHAAKVSGAAREPTVLSNHSYDGKRLATFGTDGMVMLWDLETGQKLLQFHARSMDVFYAAFSPDGTRLATGGGDNTVKIWDISSFARDPVLLHSFQVEASCERLVFTSDGSLLAAGCDDGLVKIWNAQTGKALLSLTGHSGWIQMLGFSRDEKRLFSASQDLSIREWDLSPSHEDLALVGSQNSFSGLAFRPGGEQVATGGGGFITVWDSRSGEKLRSWKAPGMIQVVAWSPDGKRLATSGSSKITQIWNPETGQLLVEFPKQTGQVWGLAWSPDGSRLVTTSSDEIITVLDPATGKPVRTMSNPVAGIQDQKTIYNVVFTPDGKRIISGSFNGSATVWDVASGKELFAQKLGSSVWGLAISQDGHKLAAGTDDGKVFVYQITDTSLKQERAFTSGQSGTFLSVAFSPDGKLVAGGDMKGVVRVWDLIAGRERLSLHAHSDFVTNVIFSPDKRRLASSGLDGTVLFSVLPLDDLITLTRSRLLRPMTAEECWTYLHTQTCPPWP